MIPAPMLLLLASQRDLTNPREAGEFRHRLTGHEIFKVTGVLGNILPWVQVLALRSGSYAIISFGKTLIYQNNTDAKSVLFLPIQILV